MVKQYTPMDTQDGVMMFEAEFGGYVSFTDYERETKKLQEEIKSLRDQLAKVKKK